MDEAKKSFPLRLSQSLFDDLKKWADQDMRSVNGQIEFILREAVRKRTGKTKATNPADDAPAE
jgi:hypothetical protein